MRLHKKPAAHSPDLTGTAILLAAAAVGAAAIETALVPGILLGGAAWLAPRAVSALRRKRRKTRSVAPTGASLEGRPGPSRQWTLLDSRNLSITTSAAKTLTFRVISAGLDFGWNYYLLGEVASAASLSGFSLVAAPTFYFLHETLWSRVALKGDASARDPASFQISSDIFGLKVSKAMAKTVTFRLFATASEFGVNYFVVRDLLLATKLSAFSIVAGPFVYLAHERAWERYEANRRKAPRGAVAPLMLPAPSGRLVSLS